MNYLPKCFDCGRFCHPAAWKMVYSGAIPMPDEEIYKCKLCLLKNGAFVSDSRIKPEHSCGLMEAA